eukprot:3603040-Lingulodinium_polyedra.AAC.1
MPRACSRRVAARWRGQPPTRRLALASQRDCALQETTLGMAGSPLPSRHSSPTAPGLPVPRAKQPPLARPL